MKDFRDIETLSAYLDGQLDAAESARVESRIKADPELASVINDLRASRNILRRLPKRKAPRNFTLTRQMVGLKPPMPRNYSLLRFATVFAAILFMCSFSSNILTPMFSFGFGGAAAPAPALGMGGGGGDDSSMQAPAAEAAPMESSSAATEAPLMEAATEEAMSMDAATMEVAPLATDGARVAETPTAKEGQEPSAEDQAQATANQPPAESEAPPFNWTLFFLVLVILGGAAMFIIRQSALRKWR